MKKLILLFMLSAYNNMLGMMDFSMKMPEEIKEREETKQELSQNNSNCCTKCSKNFCNKLLEYCGKFFCIPCIYCYVARHPDLLQNATIYEYEKDGNLLKTKKVAIEENKQ